MRSRAGSPLTGITLVALAGCAGTPSQDTGDSGLHMPLYGCIHLEPREIEFDSQELGADPETKVLHISNTCQGTLDLYDAQIGGLAPEGTFEVGAVGRSHLDAMEQFQVEVSFRAPEPGAFQGRLTIQSNDPDSPEEVVRLSGTGVGPRIQITPESHDYGRPYIGCEVGVPWSITNQGNAELEVIDIQPFTASVNEFSVDTDPLSNGPLPIVLAPYVERQSGPIIEVYLDYLPLDTFADEAHLTFYSNDPLQPEAVRSATGQGTKYGDNVDIVELPEAPSTDLLVVLDRTGDTPDRLEGLVSSLDALRTRFDTAGVDYRIAAVVDDSGCVVGPDLWIDDSFDAESAAAAFATMADLDESVSAVGPDAARLHLLAERALSTANPGSGGCNEGLLRRDSAISLLFVADQADDSGSWSRYVAGWWGLRSDPDQLVVHAIAGEYPSGCDTADAGAGFYEATVATGGTFQSICDLDGDAAWRAALASVARHSTHTPDSVSLTDLPVPPSLEVKIDSVRVNVGWEYDVSSNRVEFDEPPEPGSTIEVFYERLPACE